MKKNLLIYTLLIGFFSVLIWFVIDAGKILKPHNHKHVISNELSICKPKTSPAEIKDENLWQQYLYNIKVPWEFYCCR